MVACAGPARSAPRCSAGRRQGPAATLRPGMLRRRAAQRSAAQRRKSRVSRAVGAPQTWNGLKLAGLQALSRREARLGRTAAVRRTRRGPPKPALTLLSRAVRRGAACPLAETTQLRGSFAPDEPELGVACASRMGRGRSSGPERDALWRPIQSGRETFVKESRPSAFIFAHCHVNPAKSGRFRLIWVLLAQSRAIGHFRGQKAARPHFAKTIFPTREVQTDLFRLLLFGAFPNYFRTPPSVFARRIFTAR